MFFRSTTVGRECNEEVNRITWWMTRLPIGESLGGTSGESYPDSLRLLFSAESGGGDVVPGPLGLGSLMVRVGADGAARVVALVGEHTNGYRSMASPCAAGWSEAKSWRVPETKLVGATVVNELAPSDGPMNQPKSTNTMLGV
jgi:hypothetical protein